MTAVAEENREEGLRAKLFSLAFFFVPFLTSVFARLSNIGLPLIAFSLFVAARRSGFRWKETIVPGAALAACLALAVYCLINSMWAVNPGKGFAKASLLLGASLVVFAAATAIRHLEDWQLRRATVAFAAGASLGTLYLFLEMATNGAITRFVMNAIPSIQPESAKRVKVVDGVVTKVNLSKINQNVTNITMAAWPVLLILAGIANDNRRRLLMALFVTVTLGAVFLSEHDSSQIAVVGSTLVFLLAWRWRAATIRALAALWCLGIVLCLPLSFAFVNAGLHVDRSLPASYRARLIIWETTAEFTLEKPLLGVGVNTTRESDSMPDANSVPHEKPEGYVYPKTTAHHAHSIFLQTWYELGAIGAVLLAIAGTTVVLRIGALPHQAQPFAAATFAVFLAIAAFAWGIWQTWWMCTAALSAIYVCLAAAPRAPPAESA